MSETTPDPTNDSATGVSENGFASAETEPSMEDILASIRKIIADDADPVPLDGPVSETVSTEVSQGSVVDMAPVDFQPAAADIALDDDALDLDALLTEMEVIEPIADPAGIDDALSIPEPETEPEPEVAEIADVTADADAEVDEMDALMNELLVGLDEELPSLDPVVEDTSAADVTVASADIGTDDDLDLVKSLMADLTDEDVAGAVQTEDSLIQADADLAIPPEPVTDDTEDDILDSILNMTLEDEIAALEAQVEAEASEDSPAAEGPAAEVDAEVADSDPVPSLADIAAAAEADAAEPVQAPEPAEDASAAPAMAAVAAGAALLGGATLAASSDPVEDPETPQAEPIATAEPAPQKTPKVETTMSSALRSDAILDEVTEEATMSAFAELNTVVEEKAVFAERGPRIGDLVQEALKPMLKEWLDANLKGIVERAVAKEVKRISTGK